MAQVIYQIRKDERCYFQITSYAPEERMSSYICLNWSGLVDQFKTRMTIEEIKAKAIEWLEKKIEKDLIINFQIKKVLNGYCRN